jgi:glycerate dehydrogenase
MSDSVTGVAIPGVILDLNSLNPEDLDLSPLLSMQHRSGRPISWTHYGETAVGDVLERARGAEVIVTNKVVLDADVLGQLPDLRCVLIAATGTNNVDLAACFERNIIVCHVRDYGSRAVAQHTFALMLALAGSLTLYNSAVREGRWAQSPFFCLFDYPVVELSGKTLGIVGYGAIGQMVAKMARGFDMRVLVAESVRQGQVQAGSGASDAQVTRMSLRGVLGESDVVSLHCPLTPETHHLMSEESLSCIKPTAFLINTGRGDLVDPDALLAALQSGRLAGAGLDVLAQEPPSTSDKLIKADLPNLIITPHMAWASQEARQNIIQQVAESLADFIAGRRPARALNP